MKTKTAHRQPNKCKAVMFRKEQQFSIIRFVNEARIYIFASERTNEQAGERVWVSEWILFWVLLRAKQFDSDI